MGGVSSKLTTSFLEFFYYSVSPLLMKVVELNIVPDIILRLGILAACEGGAMKVLGLSVEERASLVSKHVAELKSMPIALEQEAANEQHYEVPDTFFQLCLGPYMKYSSGYWPHKNTTLAESEVHMLEMYCDRAQLFDGMTLCDVGCGWGSVSLFMAQKYPKATIVSISNSHSQRQYIKSQAKQRGLSNITVHTGDLATFDLPAANHLYFDRAISVEMFEHAKNYELLLAKISRWLKPGGKLFVHIFTQLHIPQHYERGWMAENFFTGGQIPHNDLLLYFQRDLLIEHQWAVNGRHYQRTLEAWLAELDKKKEIAFPILQKAYGNDYALATKWYVNWRMFYLSCAVFFGLHGGETYFVSHYLFRKSTQSK